MGNFCDVVECGRRGVYGYQSNKLTMYRCHVCGTKDPSRAAVEAAGAREGDDVHACITSCRIHTNAGLNIRLCGAVKHILEDNSCSGSGCGDLLIACGDDNGVWPKAEKCGSGVLGCNNGNRPYVLPTRSCQDA